MLENIIYLDHNAASPVLTVIQEKMFSLPNIGLNPSAVHKMGRLAKSYIENARSKILKSVNINERDDLYNLVFTSSGTESNNTIINAFKDRIIICAKTEHLSVLTPVMDSDNYRLIDVDQNGMLDLEQLEYTLKNITGTALVTVAMANNETGVIQDLKTISNLAHKYNAIMHSDAIQAYGKINFDMIDTDCDIATISCHKAGGPKGSSAIISKKSISYPCLLKGGGQEHGKRAGTENVEAIYGFGEFAEMIKQSINIFTKLAEIRDYIESEIVQFCSNSYIFGKKSLRLTNTSCISMPGHSSQFQQIAFDLNDIAISTGSACSSGKISKSHVLQAMGFNDELVTCATRVSLGHNNKIGDGQKFVEIWKEIYSNNRNISGVRI